MDSRMYETLNSIPLFQGMNGGDLNRVCDNVHLQVECLEQGDVLARQGDLCRRLTVLTGGELTKETASPDGLYRLRERVKATTVLEADILYGIQRNWGSTYKAVGDCRLILIDKHEVSRMISSMEVFRLNYLNTLCTLASRRRQKTWTKPAPTLRERFARFVKAQAEQTTGPVEMSIRMSDLASHIGGTRSLISVMLHSFADDGLLTLSRNTIRIYDIEQLR